MKYRSKIVDECEAMKWAWGTDQDADGGSTAAQIVTWINNNSGEAQYQPGCDAHGARIVVHTATGWLVVKPGDYVVMEDAWFPHYHMSCSNMFREFRKRDAECFERRWEPSPSQDSTEDD